MSNQYIELKNKHQQEVDAFPMFFAFSDAQFEKGMKKLGLNPSDTDKIYRLDYSGGFYRKSDAKAFRDMIDRHSQEMHDAVNSNDVFAYEMFLYELANHEYCITYDVEPALSACGLVYNDVLNDQRLLEIFKKAKADYLERYDEW